MDTSNPPATSLVFARPIHNPYNTKRRCADQSHSNIAQSLSVARENNKNNDSENNNDNESNNSPEDITPRRVSFAPDVITNTNDQPVNTTQQLRFSVEEIKAFKYAKK